MTSKLDLSFSKLFPGVKRYPDRHKRMRYYYRVATPNIALPDFEREPVKFRAAYDLAVASVEAVVANVIPGSMAALIIAFKRSPEYPVEGLDHERKWTRILDKLSAKHGTRGAASFDTATAKAWHREKAKTAPSVADEFLWVGRSMYQWAMEEKRFGIKVNPFLGIKKARSKKNGNKGKHHTWTLDEIGRYRARYEIGTQERLAAELALCAGFRLGDLVRIGRWCVRAGRPSEGESFAWYWDFTQEKGQLHTPQQQGCPIYPGLVEILRKTPGCWDSVGTTFLRNRYNRPWAKDGFSDWFLRIRKEAKLAGGRLPNGKRDPNSCSVHGLRHSAGHALAKAGCDPIEIAAFLGHANTAQVDTYINGHDKKVAGERAVKKLARRDRAGIVRKLITRRAV
jgi:integrase